MPHYQDQLITSSATENTKGQKAKTSTMTFLAVFLDRNEDNK